MPRTRQFSEWSGITIKRQPSCKPEAMSDEELLQEFARSKDYEAQRYSDVMRELKKRRAQNNA